MDEEIPDEVAAARHDVEQTRASMTETLGAIGEKLDPKEMMDQAKSTVHTIVTDVSSHAKEAAKEATSGAISGAVGSVVDTTKKAGSTMVETMKNNPIPSAILLGAGWYILSRRKPAGIGNNGGMDSILESAMSNPIPAALALGSAWHLYNTHNAPVTSNTLTAGDLAHKACDMVTGAASTVTGAVGSAVDTVKETAGKATDAAGSLVGSVGDGVKSVGSSLKDMVHANPLTAGVYALGVGAAIAMLLPDTEPENHLMGEARDSLMATAHQSAGNLLATVPPASRKNLDELPVGQQTSQPPPALPASSTPEAQGSGI